jgi:hypothetical protein
MPVLWSGVGHEVGGQQVDFANEKKAVGQGSESHRGTIAT